MPHEVVPEHTVTVPATVRPTLRKTLEKRFKVIDGTVVDTDTGEVIDFAHPEPEGPESVVFTMPAEAKREAAQLVAERLDQLAAAVTPEVAA
jgi:hypothetical protein